jgi:hypothetical protein
LSKKGTATKWCYNAYVQKGLSMGFTPQSEGSLTQCLSNTNIVNVNTETNTISLRPESNHSTHGTDAYQRLLAVVTIKVLFLYAWDIPVEAPLGVAGGSQATVFGANVSDLADLHV